MQITLKQKDIKNKYTDSGMLIDELAYSADHWTSSELLENNYDYEPTEPYMFNYEADLLANTKTEKDLYNIANTLEISINANITTLAEKAGLQCGAWIAIHNGDLFAELLKAYKTAVKDDNTISESFSSQIEEAVTSYNDDMYLEWLNGDRSSEGVVSLISKHYTETRDSSYDAKLDEYTFILSEYDIQEYKDRGYKGNQIKRAILDAIENGSYNRQEKDKQAREKRKSERERLAVYEKEQQAERIATLSTMKSTPCNSK